MDGVECYETLNSRCRFPNTILLFRNYNMNAIYICAFLQSTVFDTLFMFFIRMKTYNSKPGQLQKNAILINFFSCVRNARIYNLLAQSNSACDNIDFLGQIKTYPKINIACCNVATICFVCFDTLYIAVIISISVLK